MNQKDERDYFLIIYIPPSLSLYIYIYGIKVVVLSDIYLHGRMMRLRGWREERQLHCVWQEQKHPSSNARSRPAGKARYTYDDDGQHYFKECTINGGADVIFGFGRSFYDDCRIISKKDPATVVYSTTQAQAQRAPKYDGLDGTTNPAFLGFSFHNCTIEAGAGADDKVYLGRAWEDSSFVAYTYSKIANEIVPIGYDDHGNIQKPPQGYVLIYNSRILITPFVLDYQLKTNILCKYTQLFI